MPNFFRKPYGPGWALVGDAGYNKDPITAQGISDAFHDAERCAAALDEVFTGGRAFDDAMADYHRDARRPRAADLRVHDPAGDARAAAAGDAAAARRDRTATARRWTRSSASPPAPCRPLEFFDPDNIGRLMSAAASTRRCRLTRPASTRPFLTLLAPAESRRE